MKFFTHFTDGHKSYAMTELMNKFGLEGYAAYFILIELCVEKMEKNGKKSFTEDQCKFRLHERTVREKLRMRAAKVELFLNSCATLDLLQFTKVEDEFNFFIPKLVKFLNRRSKSVRQNSEKVRPDVDEDRDQHKDEDTHTDEDAGEEQRQQKKVYAIHPDLQGDPILDEILKGICEATQARWLKRYGDPAWLKRVLGNCVERHQTRADETGEIITDWGLKLTNWLGRERNPPKPGKGSFDFDFNAGEASA